MVPNEMPPLDLLAEIEVLRGDLLAWCDRLPDWPPNRYARAAIDRVLGRIDSVRVRYDAPLIVATLGGTGTGKSSLVNALIGQVVSPPGKQRPTTRRPVLVCRPGLTPAMLGIAPEYVELHQLDAPPLDELVLLDCPDPDTAEDDDAPDSNTARLRALLPHCDVLLVTSTQQKYRDARVSAELAAAATGARLVFVQTHAATSDDVRDDWRKQLARDYTPGDIFWVDSIAALDDARAGRPPHGEFARLLDYLRREFSGSAAHRIRRANVLDLLVDTLATCERRLSAELPRLAQLEQAIEQQRTKLAAKLALQMNDELLATRRSWEARLLGEVTNRWGMSPLAFVLRAYHGLGSMLSGAALWRVRTPGQLALWGALESARRLRSSAEQRSADDVSSRAVALSWEESELQAATIIVTGFVRQAGLDPTCALPGDVGREAQEAGQTFIGQAADALQAVVQRVAARQSGIIVRLWYEAWLVVLLGLLTYRLAKNFFYDSWLAFEFGQIAEPKPLLGLDFFVAAGFVLLLGCVVLVALFTRRLRRGLRAELVRLSASWQQPSSAAALFAHVEHQVHTLRASHEALQRMSADAQRLQHELARSSLLGMKQPPTIAP